MLAHVSLVLSPSTLVLEAPGFCYSSYNSGLPPGFILLLELRDAGMFPP